MAIQITKSKSLDKKFSNKDSIYHENGINVDQEENKENEESKFHDNSRNIFDCNLEKSKSQFVELNNKKHQLEKLQKKVNKVKSLDEKRKERDRYVILT